MLTIDRRLIQHFDWMLFGLVALLLAMGIVNLHSASSVSVGVSDEVRRQLMSLALGALLGALAVVVDYRHLDRLAYPIFFFSLLLLAVTLLIAPVTRGSQSWLFGGRVQPAEFAKIGLVLALARYFQRNPPGEIRRLRDLFQPACIVAAPVALIVLQRDMGVALLTLLIGSTFLAVVRIPLRAWLKVGALAVVAVGLMWTFALAPYQKDRILTVVDPGRDPLASGYQAAQSRIAIGSGGLLGAGYMEGTQTQLRFLPTQHTDFAFSVVAEEWGFVGSTWVLLCYVALLFWGLRVARNSKDDFGALLAIGAVGCLFWPAALNVGMVLGLAPVIGVPLPFFSYGGSVLVVSLMLMGLLLNISMRRYVF
ncbi:MAG: rod shape-determining protein RodA [Myxococcota bacterium]